MSLTPLQECYAIVTTAYGAGGPFYDPNQGHRGADYDRDAGEPIYAYDDFQIQSIDSGSGLGVSVGVWRKTLGGFAGFAHVARIQGREGDWILKGQILAYVAGYGDYHGTLWTGPHIHTTEGGVSAYNCSVGIRPLQDPVPHINYMVFGDGSSTAGGGPTVPVDNTVPANPNQEDEEEDMAQNSGFVYTRDSDQAVVNLIVNTESGFTSEYIAPKGNTGGYNNPVATAFNTPPFAPISDSHAQQIKRDAALVRKGL